MSELAKGGNAPLETTSVELSVSGAAQGSVDLMIFQLTDAHRVRSDADFVFFNQPTSPEGAVRLTGPDRISAELSAVPADIAVLAVAVALDDSVTGSLAGIAGLAVTVSAGGSTSAPVAGLTSERAAVLVEIYRRGDGWKVRNVSAGWSGGLSAMATELGVSVDDAPAAAAPPPVPPLSAPAAAPAPTGAPVNLPPPTGAAAPLPPPSGAAAPLPPPTGAPAPNLPPPGGKVDLGKRSGAINLTKGQRVSIDGSELIVASVTWPAATDYDVYALIRYRDGRTETVSAFGTHENKQFSLTSSDGAVRHLGDVGRAGQPRISRKEKKAMAAQGMPQGAPMAVERIEIRPHAGIQAIVPVAYSAQSNGTGSFRRYQVTMTIDNGRGTTVQIDAPNADDNDLIYSCVPGIILVTDSGIVIDSLEQYSQPKSERRPVIGPDLQIQMDAGETNLFK
ncbi:TerD family protein [Nakamurella lactea]|uniref:TerD family protein n=1 Tax=Nakamurella lactea TaxID=459515 RepID=UPI0004044008|nr:TerD family protein [Nakamurella lactea]